MTLDSLQHVMLTVHLLSAAMVSTTLTRVKSVTMRVNLQHATLIVRLTHVETVL
jgi:hypothetical protein